MRRKLIRFIILVTVYTKTECKGKQWRCPPFTNLCTCTGRHGVSVTADCRNENLTTVPKFVQNYERLKFDGNILPHINNRTFHNIRAWNITELFISRCRIETITDNTFDGFNLEFIDFSENKNINITQLGSCFQNLELKGLDLSGIHLSNHIFSFFNTSASSNLTFLRIASCGLTQLNRTMFEPFTNLKDFDISNNRLKHIDLSILPPINSLTARQTSLTELPKFKKPNDVKLVYLNVGYNNISDIDALFKYGHIFHQLRSFNIDSNPLNGLPLLTFSRLKSLLTLSLCNITSVFTNFEGITSTSLKTLNISYNRFTNPKNASQYFENSRNITHLKMNGTSLVKWADDEIFDFFTPLCNNLEKLILVKAYFRNIPSRALRCFEHMEVLDLSSNNISGWNSSEEQPFENVTIKTRFLFKDNLITIINGSSFPFMKNEKPRFYNFHGNPFSCTCKAHWFRNWMKDNYYRLGGPFGTNLFCYSPSEKKGQKFVDYDPVYEDCHGMNVYVIVGLILCGACMVLVSFATYLKNKKEKQNDGYSIIEQNIEP